MDPKAINTFERFSDDIRHSMRIANREAKWNLHPKIDTPHLLVALIKERTGLAGGVLRQRGLTARSARRVVRRTIPRQWTLNVFSRLPLSERVESVVALAVEHALSEKHDSVGTGGILLAMLRHDQVTGELLKSLAVNREELEPVLSRYLHRFMVEAPGQVLHFDRWSSAPAGEC